MAVSSLPAFDPRAVAALRRAARGEDQPGAIRSAARQFEALMLQQLLKAMRATVPENGLFDTSARKLWQELSDQQLASDLAQSGGVGLAELLARQWLPKPGATDDPAKIAAETAIAANDAPNRVAARRAPNPEHERNTLSAIASALPPVVERSFRQADAANGQTAPVVERSFIAQRDFVQTLLGLEPTLTPLVSTEPAPALVPVAADGGTPLLEGHAQRQDPARETTLDTHRAEPETTVPAALVAVAPAPSNFVPLPADAPPEERIAHFVRELLPAARRAAEALGLAPEFVLAQAALETGWGSAMLRHPDGRPSNNLFNIKAGSDWDGERVRVQTTEYRNGRPQTEIAEFRAYPSIDAAFADYVRLIAENDRYARVRGARTPEAFAQALAAAGYATDPDYAHKIVRVVRNATLQSTVAEVGMNFA